jgi:predicted DNA-binding transcriptional regulator AlpA
MDKQIEELPALITFDDIQKFLKISRNTIDRGEVSGTFPSHVKFERKRLWKKSDVIHWVYNLHGKNLPPDDE